MRVDRRLAAILAAVATLAAIVAFVILSTRQGGTSAANAGVPVPRSLAGVPLVRLLEGEEAVRTVVGIHWEKIPIERAAIAEYGADDRLYFRLWVAVVRDPCRLVEAMAEKMREYAGMLPYTAPQVINHTVRFYVTLDKRDGTLHVFWCEPPYVIWLHIYDSKLALQALREVVDFYKR